MLAPLIILPLVFIPAALASPIPFPSSDISVPTESSARSLELVGTTSPTIFLDGKFDTEIAKRECVYIHDKYSRKAEHERKVEKERGRREAHQSRRSRRSGVTTVPVANLGALDSVYIGPLSIGTPAQQLPVVFDTGSTDLVMFTQCFEGCAGGYFNAKASSTYHESNTTAQSIYPYGFLAGPVARDTVQLGSMKVDNQSFNAASFMSEGFTQGQPLPFAGILGLAFSKMSALPAPTFLDNLIASHKLADNVFSLYLRPGAEAGSTLTVGGVDSAKISGQLHSFPVVTETFWDLEVQKFWVGRKVVQTGSTRAALDSGSSYSYMPTAVVKAIYGAIPGAQQGETITAGPYSATYYNFPCENADRVGYTFGGNGGIMRFFQDANALIIPGGVRSPSGNCVGSILGADINFSDGKGGESPISIIGNAWLKSWVSVYRMNDPAFSGRPSVSLGLPNNAAVEQ